MPTKTKHNSSRLQLLVATVVTVFVLALGITTTLQSRTRQVDINQVLGATPLPQVVCTAVEGGCFNYNNQCVMYGSTCDIAKYCARPLVPCKGRNDTPPPSPTPTSYLPGLGSFRLSSPCGPASYSNITFSCNGATEVQTITKGGCYPGMESLEKAISICKSTGVPTQ